MQKRSMASALAFAVLALARPADVQAEELKGRVVSVTGGEARVALEGEILPNEGDAVAFSYQVPDMDVLARAGTGKVTGFEEATVIVRIDAGPAGPQAGFLATITSERPRMRDPVPDSMPPAGSADGPMLGIQFHGSEKPGDLTVLYVLHGSAAEAAGIRAGDVVLSVGGQEVQTFQDFLDRVRECRVGENTKLNVRRGSRSIVSTVTPLTRDATIFADEEWFRRGGEVQDGEYVNRRLGIRFRTQVGWVQASTANLGEPGEGLLGAMESEDGRISIYFGQQTAINPLDRALQVEENMRARPNLASLKCVADDANGMILRRDYLLSFRGDAEEAPDPARKTHVFVKAGSHCFEIQFYVEEDDWEASEEAIQAIIDSIRVDEKADGR